MFSAAHNGAGDGIQFESPPSDQIFLHGAPHARRRAFETRLNLRGIDLCAASVGHSACLGDRRTQLRVPIGVRQDFPNVHAGCRGYQRKRAEKAEFAPQQGLLAGNELADESKLAQLRNDGTQKRLSAGREVQTNDRGSLNESSRRNLLGFHGDRCWDHVLVSESIPEYRDVVYPVEQGNYITRRRLHGFDGRLQLIGFSGDPEHVNRFCQRGDGFRRRGYSVRWTLEHQARGIARQFLGSNHHRDIFTER